MELMVVTVVVGALASLAAPNLQRARERAQIARAVADIRVIESEIAAYMVDSFLPPASLAEIDRATLEDPWGQPYQYLRIDDGSGKGGFRKDKFLVPLNTDYDLYSLGADGASSGPLAAKDSQDDIVRALDGAFIGLAADF
jgi:general secretion pathway protein G